MTVKELKSLLERYPENVEVEYHDMGCGGSLPINYVLEEHIDENGEGYIVLDCA